MSISVEERTLVIAKAMKWNFGNLLTWERPVLLHTFGENNLSLVDAFEKKLLKARAEANTALEQMNDEDLSRIQMEPADNCQISERNRAAMLTEKVRKLNQVVPQEIAYGFGHPALAAKFEHWARMPKLSLHEVSLLSLGAEPSILKDDAFADFKRTADRGKSLWAAHASFLRQRDIFSRCYHHTGFGYAAEPVVRIKDWIDELGIQVHPKFYEGLEARTKPKAVEVKPDDRIDPKRRSRDPKDQEIETLYKLIAAMAVKGYKFDPAAKRNEATADIQSDLDQLGILLDQKTVLKWVRAACAVIPKE